MNSGGQSGSRFGLKGSEELGSGMKVGFVLENGFTADDGELDNAGRLFGREAQVYLSTDYGEISFGRVGQLTSGNGSYGIAGNLTPFGTSWSGSVQSGTYMVGYARMDKTITYKSPEFAGFRVYAQYSFDGNTKDEWNEEDHGGAAHASHTEGKTTSTRYGSLGATYGNGPLALVLTGDWYNWSSNWNYSYDPNHETTTKEDDLDDGYAVTLGGFYDFGVAKVYLAGQYFDNMLTSSSDEDKDNALNLAGNVASNLGYSYALIKGYGVTAGVRAPLWGGTGMFAVGYADTEAADFDDDDGKYKKPELKRLGASIGYTYPLSKRTNIYGVAAYYQDKVDNYGGERGKDCDPSTTTVYVGLRHQF